MYLTQVMIIEGGVPTPYSPKCPANVQPREYLHELVTMLNAKAADEKLKAVYGIDAGQVTSVTLSFAT